MALIVALNGFVPFYFSIFSMDYRLFHRQKRIVFSPLLARTRIFTGVFTLSQWVCSSSGILVIFFDVD